MLCLAPTLQSQAEKDYRPVSRSPNRVKEPREDHHEIILKDKGDTKGMYSRSFAGIVVDKSRPGPKAMTRAKTPENITKSNNKSARDREEYCVIYKFCFVKQNQRHHRSLP